jgi:hypothetical protein
MNLLCGDALQKAVVWNPMPGVSGGHAPWLVGHVARPAGQKLVNYRLSQVGNCSWDSNKYPPADGIHTPHSSCSSLLVNVSI